MEELRKYNHSNYYDVEDIASALQTISGAPEEAAGDLIESIYQLKAIAQNEYNADYYRTLYNVLLMVAEKTEE